MSETEASTGPGAGAPEPLASQRTPTAGAPILQAPAPNTEAPKRPRGPLAGVKDLRAEELAGAIAKARSTSTSDKQRLIDEAMDKGETAEMRRALGAGPALRRPQADHTGHRRAARGTCAGG